ncbi:MAG: hypothetical protein R3362_08260 [Rhodothermales bacterium]|nr:hypothetical protein [Rhodothermales bacterium]
MPPDAFDNAPLVVLLSVVGFLLLAFLLLYPVHRFLNREEQASRKWTRDEIARATRARRHGGDGAAGAAGDEPEAPDERRRGE